MQVCPSGIFIVDKDDSGQLKAMVREEERKELEFLCPGFSGCNLEKNCHDVCSGDAISHSW